MRGILDTGAGGTASPRFLLCIDVGGICTIGVDGAIVKGARVGGAG